MIKVISNLPGLRDVTAPGLAVEFEPYAIGGGVRTVLRTFFRSFRYDYIVLNGMPWDLLLLCLFKMLMPFNPCRIVAIDVLFSQPRTWTERIKMRLRGLLLAQAHHIILYYKDTAALGRALGLPQRKFKFLPFKINQFDLVTSSTPTDGGYIFCGGKTRRDFKTLIDAVQTLDYPTKIVTTRNEDIIRHGSYLDEEMDLPPHVQVVRLDGSAAPFIEHMAASRLVVLPLIPDITGVGIGVYIMAMALKKCVVISAGPSVNGVLTDDLAIIVPAQDPAALRAAIVRAWTDNGLRTRVSSRAFAYARELGSDDKLGFNVATYLRDDLAGLPAPQRHTALSE